MNSMDFISTRLESMIQQGRSKEEIIRPMNRKPKNNMTPWERSRGGFFVPKTPFPFSGERVFFGKKVLGIG